MESVAARNEVAAVVRVHLITLNQLLARKHVTHVCQDLHLRGPLEHARAQSILMRAYKTNMMP